jgi:uncharacterized membrane protein HdeD (DUF308 family)
MAANEKPSLWSWVLGLILGLLSVAVGVVVLLEPEHSLPTLAVITGIFILVDGIVGIALVVLFAREDRAFIAVLAVLDIVIGTLLIRHPVRGVEVVALLLGIWLIANGLIRALSAAWFDGSKLWRVVSGLILLIAGVVIVANPDIGYSTLAVITGIGFVGYGLALIVTELDRHYHHEPRAHPSAVQR